MSALAIYSRRLYASDTYAHSTSSGTRCLVFPSRLSKSSRRPAVPPPAELASWRPAQPCTPLARSRPVHAARVTQMCGSPSQCDNDEEMIRPHRPTTIHWCHAQMSSHRMPEGTRLVGKHMYVQDYFLKLENYISGVPRK